MMIPNRFYIDGLMQKKLNAMIAMPEHLKLSQFLFKNRGEKGEMMKEQKKKKYDEDNVAMIVEMGQTRNAAIRALMANQGNPEAALNWIFENMDRADLNDPIPDDDEEESDPNIKQGDIQQVMEMGFDEKQAKIALIKNVNNL